MDGKLQVTPTFLMDVTHEIRIIALNTKLDQYLDQTMLHNIVN